MLGVIIVVGEGGGVIWEWVKVKVQMETWSVSRKKGVDLLLIEWNEREDSETLVGNENSRNKLTLKREGNAE